ncbi:hypothetical protein M758_4G052000 [Ceratodon purpureus]|nr:hypothetical protein M758_4G052000 [Ceratodon purpureus]
MCCGADMPNLLERMPLGGEPGCREAAMDPQNIKLFGQTISVASNHTGAGADAEVLKQQSASPLWDTAQTSRQDCTDKKGVVENHISARSSSGDGFLQPPRLCKLVEYGTPNVGSRLSDDSSEGGHSDELKDQSEGDHSHSVGNDKNLPKPDKVVACPRCDSLDTKFCYYNNYNVNQPRHFCKNCQRYWTAGGTLRNVPVGAGRRKNKHGGGLQRENCADASTSSLLLGSPTSQKGTSFKQSQPKRMAGQSSPMRSPGSASSFGQESGITMSSPPYSLHQNGRLAFQPYASSQGFMTSGTDASAVGSSDTASTLQQRLQRFPSGHAFDKDCSRSSLSVLMQDTSNLNAIQTAFTPSMSQQESSATFRPVASTDMTSGWAGNDGPGRFFNGDYPNGYHLEWNRKQLSAPSTQGGASFSTPAHRAFNPGSTPPLNSSWNPAPAAQWASNVGHVPHPQMTTPEWPGTGLCISSAGQKQQLVALHTSLGKRGASDGGRLDSPQLPTKALRTDEFSRSLKSTWPMLGRNQSDVNATLKLFQPKLELAGACDQKDSFMGRLFINSAAAARPGPFPVTI